MYGLVVKTSFGVWRLNSMSPHFRVGKKLFCHSRLSVCLPVCPSQNGVRSVT